MKCQGYPRGHFFIFFTLWILHLQFLYYHSKCHHTSLISQVTLRAWWLLSCSSFSFAKLLQNLRLAFEACWNFYQTFLVGPPVLETGGEHPINNFHIFPTWRSPRFTFKASWNILKVFSSHPASWRTTEVISRLQHQSMTNDSLAYNLDSCISTC